MLTFHGASAFRKDVLEKVGYYDNDFFVSLGADDLAIRILDAGCKIKFASEITINHYEQSTIRDKKLFFNARNRVWTEWLLFRLPAIFNPLKKRKIVSFEFQKKFLKYYLLSGSMILKEKALSLANRNRGRL